MRLDVLSSIGLYLGVYFLTFLLCFHCWRCEYTKRIRSSSFISFSIILVALPFALLCAFRSIDTGYDTSTYFSIYEMQKYGIDAIITELQGYTYLYNYTQYIVFQVFGNIPSIWLFIMAFIPLTIIAKIYNKFSYKSFYFAFSYLLFLLYLSPIMLDQSRQFISVGLSVWAFYHLYKNQILKYVLIIIAASLVHDSSIILFVFLLLKYPIFNNRKVSIMLFYFVLFVSAFFLNSLSSLIFTFLPTKFAYVEAQAHDMSSGIAWLVDLIPLLLILFIYYFHRTSVFSNLLPLEACALSAIPFRLLGYYSFFIMRLSYYGEAVGIILLLVVIQNMKINIKRFYLLLLFVIFISCWYIRFVLLEYHLVLPYTFS